MMLVQPGISVVVGSSTELLFVRPETGNWRGSGRVKAPVTTQQADEKCKREIEVNGRRVLTCRSRRRRKRQQRTLQTRATRAESTRRMLTCDLLPSRAVVRGEGVLPLHSTEEWEFWLMEGGGQTGCWPGPLPTNSQIPADTLRRAKFCIICNPPNPSFRPHASTLKFLPDRAAHGGMLLPTIYVSPHVWCLAANAINKTQLQSPVRVSRTYKRKTECKALTPKLLEKARQPANYGVSKRKVANEVGVEDSTLRKRYKSTFTPDQEVEILQHFRELEVRFYGLSFKTLRHLAFMHSVRNEVTHRSDTDTELAGKEWARYFIKRRGLCLRQPQKTSIAIIMGFNRVQLNHYFDNLESLVRTGTFTPSRVYNMDETGIQAGPGKLCRIVSTKGTRNVIKAVAADKGQTFSIACAMSATISHQLLFLQGSARILL
ncbi:hypothetical protein PR048_010756 [Dryococelus australis]|uniref:HTH CENPB-type domain-containing protein n=1 Tax=Dryococelus australis TaxID=614101 RepID=A0ABQ9I3M3_9NEOP|nr:hypothetical protein PR048_010756 [Dryococelus australis]